ncbi:MAG: helix-turn-helix domain-containing protein [Bacteroidales bacterium]|nr:helix-turn-helix domain-containing protein [Bacteroidales bacterium]
MEQLLKILQDAPNISVNVRGADLISFGRDLIAQAQQQKENEKTAEPQDTLLDYKAALELFGVSGQTLWRWRKAGYIHPVRVGGKLKYRRADCIEILNGGKHGTETHN